MDRERADLLQRVTLGELPPDAPEVVAARRADPELDAALIETEGVLAALERARAEREAVLADAAARTGAPGEAVVAPFVRARTASARKRPRWAAALAIAAAALLALWLPRALDPGTSRSSDPSTPLGGRASLAAEAPVGPGSDFARFAWTADVEGGWFEVEVFGADGEPLEGGTSGPVDGREWTPDPDRVERWPEAIEWDLHWFDGSGARRESAPFSASR